MGYLIAEQALKPTELDNYLCYFNNLHLCQ